MENDISPNFKYNAIDAAIGTQLLRFEATPLAVQYFASVCDRLTHYAYWFYLSTIWVSYSGWSDLRLWKHLFRSSRPKRATSIMKPSEFEEFKKLPNQIIAYRAHRPHETDWISYTLDLEIARRFARERGVSEVVQYRLRKKDVIALFLRRGEQELIMLEPSKATRQQSIPLTEGNE